MESTCLRDDIYAALLATGMDAAQALRESHEMATGIANQRAAERKARLDVNAIERAKEMYIRRLHNDGNSDASVPTADADIKNVFDTAAQKNHGRGGSRTGRKRRKPAKKYTPSLNHYFDT